jgi:hypothetical protein
MGTPAGPHPGFRPVHAKGLVCSGTFRASAEAPRVTRAPHLRVNWCRASSVSPMPTGIPSGTTVLPTFARWRSSFSSPTARAPTLRQRVHREDARGAARVPGGSAPRLGQRPTRPRCSATLSRWPSRRARLRRAPDEEARAGQLCAGDLPCQARLPLHRRGWHNPIRPLWLCAAGRRGLSLPLTTGGNETRTSCARNWKTGCAPAPWRSGCCYNWPRRRRNGRRHRPLA